MNYPGDKSRNYNDGDVDSYLRNDQPINISHDAPASTLSPSSTLSRCYVGPL